MTHLDGQAGLIGQLLKLMLPDAGPIPIGAARISSDVKDFGVRVSAPAHPLPPFAHRLQSVAQTVEQAADGGRTHAPPLLGQRRRELRATLAGPAQGRGGVPPRERIHQRHQRSQDAGLVLLNAGASGPRGSDAARRRLGAGDLPTSLANRLPSQTGSRRDQRVAAIANGQRLGRRPPAATALVQNGRHRDALRDDRGFQLHVSLHADSMTTKRWQADLEHCPKDGFAGYVA